MRRLKRTPPRSCPWALIARIEGGIGKDQLDALGAHHETGNGAAGVAYDDRRCPPRVAPPRYIAAPVILDEMVTLRFDNAGGLKWRQASEGALAFPRASEDNAHGNAVSALEGNDNRLVASLNQRQYAKARNIQNRYPATRISAQRVGPALRLPRTRLCLWVPDHCNEAVHRAPIETGMTRLADRARNRDERRMWFARRATEP